MEDIDKDADYHKSWEEVIAKHLEADYRMGTADGRRLMVLQELIMIVSAWSE